MAERTLVPLTRCLALPDDIDDVTAAAIANPGMSSWAAYTERARLKPGETLLVNGATGASGRFAVQIVKHLGAKTVIASGRNPDALRALAALGADMTIPLGGGDPAVFEEAVKGVFARGVDVVIDDLWGPSVESILRAAAKAGTDAMPIRFVQVGALSGADITLPSALLRSSGLQLMGSGIGSIVLDRLIAIMGEVLNAACSAGFKIAATAVPLHQVEQVWDSDTGGERIVFTIGDGIS